MDFITLVFIIMLALLVIGAGFAIYGVYCMIIRNRRVRLPGEFIQEEVAAAGRQEFAVPDHPNQPASLGSSQENTGTAAVKTDGTSQGSFTMMEYRSERSKLSDSLMLRVLIIVGISLGLLIPLSLVANIVEERAALHDEAIGDIAQSWGKSQTVSGPALVIPYSSWGYTTEKVTREDGKIEEVQKRVTYARKLVVFPKALNLEAVLEPQTRYRGIHNYVVYTSPVSIRALYALPDTSRFGLNLESIHWNQAFVAVGVSDLKAINKVDPLIWNGQEALSFDPGTQIGGLLGPGFHAPVSIDPGKEQEFALSLNLNGSRGIFFTPVGETTHITIKGEWNSPSFGGELLPKTRQITTNGFSANWEIPHLSRTYPQVASLDNGYSTSANGSEITRFTAGVFLYESVPLYRMVIRAVKYGLLFIGLTFVALLCFELATRERLHLLQYGLVGISMTLFYLVLLSLAEHTAFIQAFIAASALSIAMNGLYITAAMHSKGKGMVITLLLAGLYSVLYALLQMEDYALLVGTGLVVIVVGVLMYLTRNLPRANESTGGEATRTV